MKCLVYSAKEYEIEQFEALNKGFKHELRFTSSQLTEVTTVLAKDYQAVCCFVNDLLHAGVVQSLAEQGVKMIALRSAGYNHIDLDQAKQQGTRVARVPKYSPYAVAEHAVGIILTLNRKLHRSFLRVREGNFLLNGLLGFDLHQKTVGIIGTGNIGSEFAAIMKGFGCQLLAHDPVPSPTCEQLGVKYVRSEELYKKSDIISIHCPLTADTKHLINAQSLAQMKSNVMIINTSRGAVIDTRAVINALKNEQIGYLGIDVYEEEEHLFFADHSSEGIQDDVFARLLTFPNVFITAHQAYFTEEALHNIIKTSLENLREFEQNPQSQNENFLI